MSAPASSPGGGRKGDDDDERPRVDKADLHDYLAWKQQRRDEKKKEEEERKKEDEERKRAEGERKREQQLRAIAEQREELEVWRRAKEQEQAEVAKELRAAKKRARKLDKRERALVAGADAAADRGSVTGSAVPDEPASDEGSELDEGFWARAERSIPALRKSRKKTRGHRGPEEVEPGAPQSFRDDDTLTGSIGCAACLKKEIACMRNGREACEGCRAGRIKCSLVPPSKSRVNRRNNPPEGAGPESAGRAGARSVRSMPRRAPKRIFDGIEVGSEPEEFRSRRGDLAGERVPHLRIDSLREELAEVRDELRGRLQRLEDLILPIEPRMVSVGKKDQKAREERAAKKAAEAAEVARKELVAKRTEKEKKREEKKRRAEEPEEPRTPKRIRAVVSPSGGEDEEMPAAPDVPEGPEGTSEAPVGTEATPEVPEVPEAPHEKTREPEIQREKTTDRVKPEEEEKRVAAAPGSMANPIDLDDDDDDLPAIEYAGPSEMVKVEPRKDEVGPEVQRSTSLPAIATQAEEGEKEEVGVPENVPEHLRFV
ncbi:hypothetical protein B0H15DRAFT_953006 [Mycena belliarum]|uniref:Zn(2)-C6 fungal-type domain-containing protein n=1 Tax=Mycena belliarum TaxID=1033014 RepID=A0AAD6U1M4_9AGAR|nr:hypothetical protein B0H15DRAFT_953006 [Mycena belliae]